MGLFGNARSPVKNDSAVLTLTLPLPLPRPPKKKINNLPEKEKKKMAFGENV